ncbi:unnamed protein product [Durusdinium trenchii]|uniref:Uncharacterized protein n=1 Tax=Durusdinium trenchii TaxID=1381693 RepID=A0ABP0L7B8_9DINO
MVATIDDKEEVPRTPKVQRQDAIARDVYIYLQNALQAGRHKFSIPAMVVPAMLGTDWATEEDVVIRHLQEEGQEGMDWKFFGKSEAEVDSTEFPVPGRACVTLTLNYDRGPVPFVTPHFARLLVIRDTGPVGRIITEFISGVQDEAIKLFLDKPSARHQSPHDILEQSVGIISSKHAKAFNKVILDHYGKHRVPIFAAAINEIVLDDDDQNAHVKPFGQECMDLTMLHATMLIESGCPEDQVLAMIKDEAKFRRSHTDKDFLIDRSERGKSQTEKRPVSAGASSGCGLLSMVLLIAGGTICGVCSDETPCDPNLTDAGRILLIVGGSMMELEEKMDRLTTALCKQDVTLRSKVSVLEARVSVLPTEKVVEDYIELAKDSFKMAAAVGCCVYSGYFAFLFGVILKF